jgi:hypothetical protein
MDRYMPVTGIDCSIAALLIDTEAPLDVLHETAAYRIRTATQLLESFAVNENVHSELARVLVTSLLSAESAASQGFFDSTRSENHPKVRTKGAAAF